MPAAIKLTDAKCRALRKRYEQGTPLVEMVVEFGYSRIVLTRAIRRSGGEIRPRGRVTTDLSDTDPRFSPPEIATVQRRLHKGVQHMMPSYTGSYRWTANRQDRGHIVPKIDWTFGRSIWIQIFGWILFYMAPEQKFPPETKPKYQPFRDALGNLFRRST